MHIAVVLSLPHPTPAPDVFSLLYYALIWSFLVLIYHILMSPSFNLQTTGWNLGPLIRDATWLTIFFCHRSLSLNQQLSRWWNGRRSMHGNSRSAGIPVSDYSHSNNSLAKKQLSQKSRRKKKNRFKSLTHLLNPQQLQQIKSQRIKHETSRL